MAVFFPAAALCGLFVGCIPDLGEPVENALTSRDGGSAAGDAGSRLDAGQAPDAGLSNADLVKKGEIVFFTIEGVGCAHCHGRDAKGDIGPNIRGKTRDDVLFCLQTVEQMAFLHPTDEEIDAVVAYLQYLTTQP